MIPGKNEFYTGGGYLQNNPTWHAEDAMMKASVINGLITKHKLDSVNVVEIGCGAGANLVELGKLNPAIQVLKGFDISPQAISIAKPFENTRLSFYCEDFFLTDTAKPDVLLMIDVLEHVEDYIGFLQNLKERSNHFIFHIPLDLSCRTILKPHVLYQQRRSVGHIHYFSKEIIEWALEDAGYQVLDQVYTKPAIDTGAVKSLKGYAKKHLRNFSFFLNPHWSAKNWGGYSIMFLLK